MGANQSTSDKGPKIFHSETPIEISPDVVNNLSARLTSETILERQFATDSVEDGSTRHGLKTGIALIGDLEEIREKVDRFQTRRHLSDFPSVKGTGEAIVSCYKMNLTTPLECWREVARFKAAVADAEAVRESLEPFHFKA